MVFCVPPPGGRATLHALGQLEARGVLFTHPTAEVYEGMIVGEHSREGDLDVNPVREKKLTNMRSTGAEDKIHLTPPRCGPCPTGFCHFLGFFITGGWHMGKVMVQSGGYGWVGVCTIAGVVTPREKAQRVIADSHVRRACLLL